MQRRLLATQRNPTTATLTIEHRPTTIIRQEPCRIHIVSKPLENLLARQIIERLTGQIPKRTGLAMQLLSILERHRLEHSRQIRIQSHPKWPRRNQKRHLRSQLQIRTSDPEPLSRQHHILNQRLQLSLELRRNPDTTIVRPPQLNPRQHHVRILRTQQSTNRLLRVQSSIQRLDHAALGRRPKSATRRWQHRLNHFRAPRQHAILRNEIRNHTQKSLRLHRHLGSTLRSNTHTLRQATERRRVPSAQQPHSVSDLISRCPNLDCANPLRHLTGTTHIQRLRQLATRQHIQRLLNQTAPHTARAKYRGTPPNIQTNLSQRLSTSSGTSPLGLSDLHSRRSQLRSPLSQLRSLSRLTRSTRSLRKFAQLLSLRSQSQRSLTTPRPPQSQRRRSQIRQRIQRHITHKTNSGIQPAVTSL